MAHKPGPIKTQSMIEGIVSTFWSVVRFIKWSAIIFGGLLLSLCVYVIVASRYEPREPMPARISPVPAQSPAPATLRKTEPTPAASPDADRTWVDGYTRKDGTKVKGHWRKLK